MSMEVFIHIPESGTEVSLYRLNAAGVEPALESIAGPVPFNLADAGAIPQLATADRQNNDFPLTGQKLFTALNQGVVGVEWARLRAAGGLKTHLCVQNAALAALPWELATDVAPLATEAPLLRCVQFPPSREGAAPIWPLRIFVLRAANPVQEGIKAKEEVWAIRQALRDAEHSVDLEVYETAADPAFTINKLVEALRVWPRGPHILHIIGHSEPGMLKLFVPPAAGPLQGGSYIKWTLAQIATALPDLPDLRLVYANACRSNIPGGGNPAAPLSVAQVFLRQAAAVIAMQADVSGDAAVECASVFYKNLAAGDGPDVALQKARRNLLNIYQETGRDTYTPVLTTRLAASDILVPPKLQWSDATQSKWLNCLERPLKLFVNQRPHRRKLLPVLFDPQPQQRAALLRGEEGVGKTWLLQWFAFVMAGRGARAHYVAINGPADWLQVLCRIRDGAFPAEPHTQGLDPDLQSEFNWKLNHLAGANGVSQAAPPFPPGTVEADRAGRLPEILQRKALLNDFPVLVCDAMAYALRQQAGRVPLTLILDSVSSPEFGILKSRLLDPLTGGAAGANIRVVVCVDSALWDVYKGFDFSGWEDIVVGPIEVQQARTLIPELLRLQFKDRNTKLEALLEDLTDSSLKVGDLYQLCRSSGVAKGLTWALNSSPA
jgi:hypothetical protein